MQRTHFDQQKNINNSALDHFRVCHQTTLAFLEIWAGTRGAAGTSFVSEGHAAAGQLTLQFRAELFNVLNRANFRAPSAITFTPSGLRYRRAITSTSTSSRQTWFGLNKAERDNL